MTEQFSRVVNVAPVSDLRVSDPRHVTLETVTIPPPAPPAHPFRLTPTGYDMGVSLGSFGVLRFDSMISRIDPKCALRAAIVAALNADPHLADDIKAAAFTEPPTRS